MNRAFYMLLFTFSLYGCNVEMSQKVNETLYQAENCMEEFPDSALSLLQHISHPEDLKGKAQADYALLYSQACDKNQISITNDSLIRIAVRYYKDKDEDLNAAKSYFYLGCVYRNANQDAMAIEAYLKALDKMPKGKPHKLWMQIYFNLGERYRYQNLYGSSMEMFQKCLGASKELKDSSLLFFPYREIARTYLFEDKNDKQYKYAESFISGILNRIEEITLFLNSSTNSYKRLGKDKAPKYITWSKENRSQLIRIPASKGDRCRMELRSPDSSCNPYIAFALLIKAGIEGIEKNLQLCNPHNINLFNANDNEVKNLKTLPNNLNEAINNALNSEFIKTVLPQKTINNYIDDKKQEWDIYNSITDKFKAEKELYFEKF